MELLNCRLGEHETRLDKAKVYLQKDFSSYLHHWQWLKAPVLLYAKRGVLIDWGDKMHIGVWNKKVGDEM